MELPPGSGHGVTNLEAGACGQGRACYVAGVCRAAQAGLCTAGNSIGISFVDQINALGLLWQHTDSYKCKSDCLITQSAGGGTQLAQPSGAVGIDQ